VTADRSPSNPEPETTSGDKCPACGGIGSIVVSRFRWAGADHLHWRCTACHEVWVTPDRRKEPRVGCWHSQDGSGVSEL